MNEKENQTFEADGSYREKVIADMNKSNSEAYLNAMRQLEREKEDAKKAEKAEKKAKRKKRRKKILIAILIIIAALILLFSLMPSMLAGDSVGNIKDYISDPENRTQSLSYLVNEYIGYDFHSEEKEMKNLFKLGKEAIKQEDFVTAAYLFKVCTDFSEEYNEKIAKEIEDTDADEIFLKGARESVKSSDYKTAVELYSVYKGQEDIINELKEAKYNLAISYVEKEEYISVYDILEDLGDYKYSKELLLWSRVTSNKDFDASSSARSELKSRLKDPSSYQEISVYSWSTPIIRKAENGNPMIQIVRYVSIDYSATNSYGGRISDTYYWDTDGPSFSGEGLKEKELEELIKMKKKDIIEKARSF